MVPEGFPIPESTPFTQPFPVATLSAGISSPPPIPQEKKEGEEEGFVDLTDSLEDFEIFNQPSSPKSLPEEMGIQRKPKKSLMKLIEDQPRRGDLGSLLNPSFHLLRRSLLLVLLSQPCPLGPNRLIRRGGESRKAKT